MRINLLSPVGISSRNFQRLFTVSLIFFWVGFYHEARAAMYACYSNLELLCAEDRCVRLEEKIDYFVTSDIKDPPSLYSVRKCPVGKGPLGCTQIDLGLTGGVETERFGFAQDGSISVHLYLKPARLIIVKRKPGYASMLIDCEEVQSWADTMRD